jgi:hypothetical protein
MAKSPSGGSVNVTLLRVLIRTVSPLTQSHGPISTHRPLILAWAAPQPNQGDPSLMLSTWQPYPPLDGPVPMDMNRHTPQHVYVVVEPLDPYQ